jgi:hypothetical protein
MCARDALRELRVKPGTLPLSPILPKSHEKKNDQIPTNTLAALSDLVGVSLQASKEVTLRNRLPAGYARLFGGIDHEGCEQRESGVRGGGSGGRPGAHRRGAGVAEPPRELMGDRLLDAPLERSRDSAGGLRW